MSAKQSAPGADSARQRLVVAAIEQIEKSGISRLTVRDVAAAAEANIAAVNYYFGSKEALIQAALEESIRHLVGDAQAHLDKVAKDPAQALTNLFEYMFEGALRFPYVSKAHLHAAFSEDDYSGPFPSMFAPVMLRIRDILREHVAGLDEHTAGRRTVAALSAVFFPACFAELYRPLRSLDSGRERKTYIEEIVEHLLAPAAARASGRKRRDLRDKRG